MNIEIKITGSGKDVEVAYALRVIADDIESGCHIASLQDDGECEWGDSALFTTITVRV